MSHPAFRSATLIWLAIVVTSTATRCVLTVLAWSSLDPSPGSLLGIATHGLASDALLAAAFASPALLVGALSHGSGPPGRVRRAWRLVATAGILCAAGFTSIAELLFWSEFDSRFNFIAVDYLIYTQEVIGNIRESYPVGAILGTLALASLALAWLIERRPDAATQSWRWPARVAVAVLALCAGALAGRLAIGVDSSIANAPSLRGNAIEQEIARNGSVAFIAALRDNGLSFQRFYATIEPGRVETLAGTWPRKHAPMLRAAHWIADSTPRHVVLIEVESLSASFLGVFGDPRGLTPELDALAGRGMLFTDLHATGTRTVRGLEAMSTGLPPLPGESVVRRPEGEGLFTLGSVLRENGFDTSFLYGGYGYFDNMNAYFASNGYRVLDRTSIPAERVGFSTIWGVSDEYLFDFALEQLDRAVAGGRRQFFHLMTTSNHRPYTYPDNRVDIPSKTGRGGAVKYTDWAIGRFIEQARSHPWFDDTLFVIVADHCASVAGKTRIPPDRYRIPAIFYAPKFVSPSRIDALASQIDLPPTILARLGIDDGGRFFGQDLLSPGAQPRAWLGNYQEVGLLVPGENGSRDLVVLAPKRKVSQYRIDPDGSAHAVPVDPAKAERTIADYQLADRMLRDWRYRQSPVAVAAAGNTQR